MTPDNVRRQILLAICRDDLLMETLVLKGGNALSLIHDVGGRASLDMDFSMKGDFEDLEDIRARFQLSLDERFGSLGYKVLDFTIEPKPTNPTPHYWGGYRSEFKLISHSDFERLRRDMDRSRKEAIAIDGSGRSSRKFRVEISKFEYVADAQKIELEGLLCYVYTPTMIAAEKIRAICQQMEGYALVRRPRARARDFYDIYALVTESGVNFNSKEFRDLVSNMFAVKEVSLSYIPMISEHRAFHAQDWPAVRDSVSAEDGQPGFDFYFDFVVIESQKLKPLWEE